MMIKLYALLSIPLFLVQAAGKQSQSVGSIATVPAPSFMFMGLPGDLLLPITRLLPDKDVVHWISSTKVFRQWAEGTLSHELPVFWSGVYALFRKDTEALHKLLLAQWSNSQDTVLKDSNVRENVLALTRRAIASRTNRRALLRLLSRLLQCDFASPGLCMLFEVLPVPKVCQLLLTEDNDTGTMSPALQQYVCFLLRSQERGALIRLSSHIRLKSPAKLQSFLEFFLGETILSDNFGTITLGANVIAATYYDSQINLHEMRRIIERQIENIETDLADLKTRIIGCIRTLPSPEPAEILDRFCQHATYYVGFQFVLYKMAEILDLYQPPAWSLHVEHGIIDELFRSALELGRLDVVRKMVTGHNLIASIIVLYLGIGVPGFLPSQLPTNTGLMEEGAIEAERLASLGSGQMAPCDCDALLDVEYGDVSADFRARLTRAMKEAYVPILCFRYFRLIFACVMLNQPRRLAFLLSNPVTKVLSWVLTRGHFGYFLVLERKLYPSEDVRRVLLAHVPK